MRLVIDGQTVDARPGSTVLEASLQAGKYIPFLCYHPDLPTFSRSDPAPEVYRGAERISGDPGSAYKGCGLCVVQIEGSGDLVLSCEKKIEEGLVVSTAAEAVKASRRQSLARILKNHPRACLLCAQKEGCSREPCSTDVPAAERCCPLLGRCELEKVAEFTGVSQDMERYKPLGMQKLPDEPLFKRDYNLCVGCTRCVRACNELRGVKALGYVVRGDTVLVGTLLGTTLRSSGCRFCGACVEVCPTGALADIETFSLAEKESALVPCRTSCPASVDVPSYVRAIGSGESSRALSLVFESVPMPGILGSVCHHPCEDVCRRGKIDDPVAICDLKRFAAENGVGARPSPPSSSTGKKAAVIGSGPAGLSAAYYLRTKGHGVTVFEQEEKPGGMLRYGIPRFRLPDELLESEIASLLEDVDLRTGRALGRDFSLDDLAKEGFQVVFIGTGMGVSRRLEIPGVHGEAVHWGMDFLKGVNSGQRPELGPRVVVIGGGNVAIDVALTSLRLGASDVTLACLECESEMPAFKKEVSAAREEGVRIMNSWGPAEILLDGGRAKGVTLKRCTSVFDEAKRFCPCYDESVLETVRADSVILAVGQAPDGSLFSAPGMPRLDPTGILRTEGARTVIPHVFAGGDLTRGPASVVEAVRDGRRAASEMDRFMGGDGLPAHRSRERGDPFLGRDEQFHARPRLKMPCSDPGARRRSFAAIELGYNKEQALSEAKRCLACDLRLDIGTAPLPPEKWIVLEERGLEGVPEAEGVYQIADEKKKPVRIAGTQNLRKSLSQLLGDEEAKFFCFEEDPMYSKRESELLQQHLQKYGELPRSGEEDIDDLF